MQRASHEPGGNACICTLPCLAVELRPACANSAVRTGRELCTASSASAQKSTQQLHRWFMVAVARASVLQNGVDRSIVCALWRWCNVWLHSSSKLHSTARNPQIRPCLPNGIHMSAASMVWFCTDLGCSGNKGVANQKRRSSFRNPPCGVLGCVSSCEKTIGGTWQFAGRELHSDCGHQRIQQRQHDPVDCKTPKQLLACRVLRQFGRVLIHV